MEYKSQRLMRDARIFSIYEGTTQLQVVAAIRYITNGTYLGIINEMLEEEVLPEFEGLKAKVKEMTVLYEQSVKYVKESADQEVQDFLSRRLYDMTADIVMSLLLLRDASAAPEMFGRSANVYVRMAEEEVIGKSAYVTRIIKEDLASFRH